MQVTIKWIDKVAFVGQSGSGHSVIMDGVADHGGRNLGIRPMEMLLLGLGGCASVDIISILKKGRQPLAECVAEIQAQRSDQIPAVFTHIHIHFKVTGEGLKESLVARAVHLSAEKYCSASIMLTQGGVEISHDYEVIDNS